MITTLTSIAFTVYLNIKLLPPEWQRLGFFAFWTADALLWAVALFGHWRRA